jgi:riboflavin synthase
MGADKFKKTPIENAILVDIDILESFFYYVLEKGSIAIDGTSLTIFKTTKNCVTYH